MKTTDEEWLTIFAGLKPQTLSIQQLSGHAIMFAKILCSVVVSTETDKLLVKQALVNVASTFESVWPNFDVDYGGFTEVDEGGQSTSFISEFIDKQLKVLAVHLALAEREGFI